PVSYQMSPLSSFRSSSTVLISPASIMSMIGSFSSGVAQVQPVACTPIIGGAPGAPGRASSILTVCSAVLPTSSVAVITTAPSGGSGYETWNVPSSPSATSWPSTATAVAVSSTRPSTTTSSLRPTGAVGLRISMAGGVVSTAKSIVASDEPNGNPRATITDKVC